MARSPAARMPGLHPAPPAPPCAPVRAIPKGAGQSTHTLPQHRRPAHLHPVLVLVLHPIPPANAITGRHARTHIKPKPRSWRTLTMHLLPSHGLQANHERVQTEGKIERWPKTETPYFTRNRGLQRRTSGRPRRLHRRRQQTPRPPEHR